MGECCQKKISRDDDEEELEQLSEKKTAAAAREFSSSEKKITEVACYWVYIHKIFVLFFAVQKSNRNVYSPACMQMWLCCTHSHTHAKKKLLAAREHCMRIIYLSTISLYPVNCPLSPKSCKVSIYLFIYRPLLEQLFPAS